MRGAGFGRGGLAVLAALLCGACSSQGDNTLERCFAYCDRERQCAATGAVDDEALAYCKEACADAVQNPAVSIDPKKLDCAENTDCKLFAACLNGDGSR